MDQNWQALISAILGGMGVTAIAKYFLQRSYEKLEELPSQLADLKSEIRVLLFRLEDLSDLKSIVHEHDRKIVALEHKRTHREYANGKD